MLDAEKEGDETAEQELDKSVDEVKSGAEGAAVGDARQRYVCQVR